MAEVRNHKLNTTSPLPVGIIGYYAASQESLGEINAVGAAADTSQCLSRTTEDYP